jgi:FkbM family methyltransferase
MRFSQNNEEDIILDALTGPPGRFLDIGAHDGVSLSNTRAMALTGWRGVAVEPSSVVDKLRENCRQLPGIEVLELAVTPDHSGPVLLSESTLINTLRPDKFDMWPIAEWQKRWVPGVCLAALFAQVGYDFDLISIDAEGSSADLFRLLPFDKLTKLRAVCVEHDGHAVELCVMAERAGFFPRLLNQENLIVVRNIIQQQE